MKNKIFFFFIKSTYILSQLNILIINRVKKRKNLKIKYKNESTKYFNNIINID